MDPYLHGVFPVAVQIKAFMTNAMTATQDVAVLKNFMKNTIHVVMRNNF